MNILIVDDSIYIRSMLRRILENAGHCVCGEAANGEDAITKYDELKPDLVTMDIIMPDMSGIKAMEKIKEDNPDAKIVIVSAMEQKPLTLEAVKAGAIGYIVKPFKPEDILVSIDKFMNANGTQQ
ncbi:MAG: response regulator [candidate division WOR-3 bacterium]|nr:MAG: response regulator [candidate division WOR-3 bacterium]